MKRMNLILIFGSLIMISACAHHRNVRPGQGGINKVVIKTDDTENAAENALSQANHFCKEVKGGKSAVVVEEGEKYTGDMDEKDYKKLKTASKVATTVGGVAHVFGGKNESNAGGVALLGGVVGDTVAGKGYTYQMTFKCE